MLNTKATVGFSCGVLDAIFTGALLTVKGLPDADNFIKGPKLGLVIGSISIAVSTLLAFDSWLLDVFGLALGGYAAFETFHKRGKLMSFDKIDRPRGKYQCYRESFQALQFLPESPTLPMMPRHE